METLNEHQSEVLMMTMDGLMARKDLLEQTTSIVCDILKDSAGPMNSRHLMRTCIKPRGTDLQDKDWNPSAKERVDALERACRLLDVTSALKNGQLVRPTTPNPFEERLLNFADESRELAGLKEVLGWLKQFHAIVETGDSIQVLNYLVQIGVNMPKNCDCEVDDVGNCPTLFWLHTHHLEYNQVVWQIISAKPGMIESLRQALEADIHGPSKRMGRRVYGNISSRGFARKLVTFIKEKPSHLWVGDSSRPS